MTHAWEIIVAVIELIWKLILKRIVLNIHTIFGYRDLSLLEDLVFFFQAIWPVITEIIGTILDERASFYERLQAHEERGLPPEVAIDITDEEDLSDWEDLSDEEDLD